MNKLVSKEEFNKFINEYKYKLDRSVCFFGEYPSIQYHDFESKSGFGALVASYCEKYDGTITYNIYC